MIFETHAHYDDEQFDKDREELLDSMEKNGIGTIVNIGSNMETSRWTVKLQISIRFFMARWGFIRQIPVK